MTLLPNELSWDVFGYYLYLPSTFIHNDFMLHDTTWITAANVKYNITGTLYQLGVSPKNTTIYFFLMGMSWLYAPWFFLAHFVAGVLGYPQDGFSIPYQHMIALGCLFYTLLGMWYWRKILLRFFSDRITALVMIIVVLGTNYLHFVTIKNLETVHFIFMLNALLVWNTIRWHEAQKQKNILAIGLIVALMAMIKPSEVLSVFIPVIWGIYNKDSYRKKWKLIKEHKSQIFIAVAAGFSLFIPQMIYWKISTGFFIYDSYKNPGVGLDLLTPHIINILFSFRKGWFLYTPVMLFAITGFYFLYKKQRAYFPVLAISFLISFYIIASWTEWWYGAGYSVRPMVATYLALSIPLGFSLRRIGEMQVAGKSGLGFLIVLLIGLNLFQMWQFNNYILDPYRTTRAYYFATFGKINVSDSDRKLLRIDRAMDGNDIFPGDSGFRKKTILDYNFKTKLKDYESHYDYDANAKNEVLRLDSTLNFSPGLRTHFEDLTSAGYAWVRASVDVLIPEGYLEELPCLVVTIDRRNGVYGYRTACIDPAKVQPNTWVTIKLDYLTPELRSGKDNVQSYIWHRGKKPIYIDNYRIDFYEPLKGH
jgi:hypothetical protein